MNKKDYDKAIGILEVMQMWQNDTGTAELTDAWRDMGKKACDLLKKSVALGLGAWVDYSLN